MNAVLRTTVSIESLENGNIDAEAFDHESHVYAAWLYLDRWPLHEAIGRFRGALQRLTLKLGDEKKYHETVTWFFLILIEQRRVASRAVSWTGFRQENADLVGNAGDILGRYYSKELLGSDTARQHFLLPDQLATRES